MQITSICLGNLGVDKKNEPIEAFKVKTNGNSDFIENTITGQRLRLDPAFARNNKDIEIETSRDYVVDEFKYVIFDIYMDMYGTLANNYCTLNPFIIRSKPKKDFVLAYINFDTTTYLPLRYKSNVEIRTTYRGHNLMGALLNIPVSLINDDKCASVMSINVKNKIKDTYETLTITFEKNEGQEPFYDIDVDVETITDQENIKYLDEIMEKNNGKPLTFKYFSTPTRIDTKYLLVNEKVYNDKKYEKLLKSISDKSVIIKINDNDDIVEKIKSLKNDPDLSNDNIRSITEIGGNSLTYDMMNELRLLYVFRMTVDENGAIKKTTVKSN